MENNQEIISDLKGLISIINDGKEGYMSAADSTDNVELKAVFAKYVAERKLYETELKAHLAKHGAASENDEGGILGAIHRTWIDIKEALTDKSETALLGAVITGEKAALEKYDMTIKDNELHSDHLNLLTSQRNGIAEALKEIEVLEQKYKDL
ncbi:PA2169 family four-helix-bundle protein [Pedobacter boryungensis]|uniref:PA2169 family four-helix-bundle protein n=1 Tax=Pedobacter boryungensis TaxID=869962 RepID=A0ABX2DCA8_9SPHI|nr:PA2169 family four-helix-bundle protein [Pedobacter boryungensis]NQX31073.1 PA2169 family four-helix-bundle protein [Pedobacter boryungensis]